MATILRGFLPRLCHGSGTYARFEIIGLRSGPVLSDPFALLLWWVLHAIDGRSS
jgi:hypothetical protein